MKVGINTGTRMKMAKLKELTQGKKRYYEHLETLHKWGYISCTQKD